MIFIEAPIFERIREKYLSDDEFEPAEHVSETEDNVDVIEADSSTGDESQSDEEHEQVRFYKFAYYDADFANEINCFVKIIIL